MQTSAKPPLVFEDQTKPLQFDNPAAPIQWRSSNAVKHKADFKSDDIYSLWKADPTPDNGAALLNSLEPSLRSAARRHTGSDSPVMLSKARSIIIDALPRYDGRSSLPTFVDRQLQPLQRWAAKHRVGIKVPSPVVQQRRMLQEAESELEDMLGRSPSRAEIADHTGIPLKRIQKVLAINLPTVGERTSTSEDGQSSSADAQGVEDDGQLWAKSVYYSLNPINQFIMEHTQGLYGARVLSNRELAKKLKISPAAVSQRKAKIQKMLDQN